MLNQTLRVEVACAGGPRELKRSRGFRVTIPSYGPPLPTVPLANIAGGVSNPTARPFAPVGLRFVDKALLGRLAFATLSRLVVASAINALMNMLHGCV